MRADRAITSEQETPVFIPSESGDLFGILTRPAGAGNGIGVVLLLGGIYTLSLNRNRLSVRLARHLASLGYLVLRLDVHGTGESGGTVEEYELERPYGADLEAAARWLLAQGAESLVLAGSCFGARTCLAAAPGLERVRGVALLSMPVLKTDRIGLAVHRHSQTGWAALVRRACRLVVVRRLLDRRFRRHYAQIVRSKLSASRGRAADDVGSRVSPLVLRQLESLAGRGVPVLLAYGTEDLRDEFRLAAEGRLRGVLRAPSVAVRFAGTNLHGFSSLEAQAQGAELLVEWLETIPTARPASLANQPIVTLEV